MRLLFCLFFLNFVLSEKTFTKEDYFWMENVNYENLTVPIDNLGFRIICEKEIWINDFKKIQKKFTKCLDLNIIIESDKETDEEKQKRNYYLLFGDINTNFYCRLAKNWMKCYKYLNEQHCLQPDPETIDKLHVAKLKESLLQRYQLNSKLDQYDWRIMNRPYKIMCELSKLQFQISPFGPLGKNMWF